MKFEKNKHWAVQEGVSDYEALYGSLAFAPR